jgi:hypothetical protein
VPLPGQQNGILIPSRRPLGQRHPGIFPVGALMFPN